MKFGITFIASSVFTPRYFRIPFIFNYKRHINNFFFIYKYTNSSISIMRFSISGSKISYSAF